MTHIQELDTPALVVDLDVMERNLERVASYAREHRLRLRPHTKTHKIPALGRRQLELGAVGLTVAKVSEAEVMLSADPEDLLVAYPVIGMAKLQRLVSLPARTGVTVALDSEYAARVLSEAAVTAGTAFRVLLEVDMGLHRVGVPPEEGAKMAQLISTLPGLEFDGVTFYPGHIKQMDGIDEQIPALSSALDAVVSAVEDAGLPCRIVSGGSTPTLFHSHRVSALNEIRPGTYIFNDRNTWLSGACSLEDCAASILTTVVSTAVKDQIIVDGGSKTFSSDKAANGIGFGYFPDAPRAVLEKMNEEHGFVDIREEKKRWNIGEKVRIVPNHVCVAVNLHERVYGVRGENVEECWAVEGRGKLQ